MKKSYDTPSAEKMEFNYLDQVVTASSGCYEQWINETTTTDNCDSWDYNQKLN